MKQHQCRRGFKINVSDEEKRDVVDRVKVIEPRKNYSLFNECRVCGYGSKTDVLESRESPFPYYTIKTCKFRLVK